MVFCQMIWIKAIFSRTLATPVNKWALFVVYLFQCLFSCRWNKETRTFNHIMKCSRDVQKWYFDGRQEIIIRWWDTRNQSHQFQQMEIESHSLCTRSFILAMIGIVSHWFFFVWYYTSLVSFSKTKRNHLESSQKIQKMISTWLGEWGSGERTQSSSSTEMQQIKTKKYMTIDGNSRKTNKRHHNIKMTFEI